MINLKGQCAHFNFPMWSFLKLMWSLLNHIWSLLRLIWSVLKLMEIVFCGGGSGGKTIIKMSSLKIIILISKMSLLF